MMSASPAKRYIKRGGLNPGGWYWMLYLLPALLIYALFMAWPLLSSIQLSLYTGNQASRSFVGFDNFRKLFTPGEVSTRYWGAFGHTWVFFAVHMGVQNVLGILFATMLTNRTMKGRVFYQTVIFLPTTFAVLVTGYLWKLLLNPLWSKAALNPLGLGVLARPWLGEAGTALLAVSLVSCWQWLGIPTMMFVAALRNISEDLLEAADIEGCNSFQAFWYIKFPLVRPVAGMVAILTFVSNFNAFDAVYALETVNGGPNYATDLIGTLFYRVGIAGQHPVGIPDQGLGAAIAVITFIVLAIFVIPTLRLTQSKGDL